MTVYDFSACEGWATDQDSHGTQSTKKTWYLPQKTHNLRFIIQLVAKISLQNDYSVRKRINKEMGNHHSEDRSELSKFRSNKKSTSLKAVIWMWIFFKSMFH